VYNVYTQNIIYYRVWISMTHPPSPSLMYKGGGRGGSVLPERDTSRPDLCIFFIGQGDGKGTTLTGAAGYFDGTAMVFDDRITDT
jgi:hypothetical protein